ncbi:hypothetical protein AB0E10_29210 [Streptomyces sp. NPDC048045]|uniref:hypothetical protein n=1 Tax=Streptomyces sp. NPDC048045 TaxID=3154710 RepID=UPI00344AD7DF
MPARASGTTAKSVRRPRMSPSREAVTRRAARTRVYPLVVQRTGLAQSQVSNCVARLRSAEAVLAEPDPRDGRRTLLRAAAEPSQRLKAVREAPLGPALAAADDPDEVLALLERLSTLLR